MSSVAISCAECRHCEHGFDVASYSTICEWVCEPRPVIAAEAKAAARHASGDMPREHAPGAEAEVDFANVWVQIAGVRTECHMEG
jgi:hypothetical protein